MSNFKYKKGERYGTLTIISDYFEVRKYKNKSLYSVMMRCDCGYEFNRRAKSLHLSSCKKCISKKNGINCKQRKLEIYKQLSIGKTYQYLTVVDKHFSMKGRILLPVICKCGKRLNIRSRDWG